MSVSQLTLHRRDRRESKFLVVLISTLQLSLVVLVWLLAIAPAVLLALGVMTVRALRGALGARASAPSSD